MWSLKNHFFCKLQFLHKSVKITGKSIIKAKRKKFMSPHVVIKCYHLKNCNGFWKETHSYSPAAGISPYSSTAELQVITLTPWTPWWFGPSPGLSLILEWESLLKNVPRLALRVPQLYWWTHSSFHQRRAAIITKKFSKINSNKNNHYLRSFLINTEERSIQESKN